MTEQGMPATLARSYCRCITDGFVGEFKPDEFTLNQHVAHRVYVVRDSGSKSLASLTRPVYSAGRGRASHAADPGVIVGHPAIGVSSTIQVAGQACLSTLSQQFAKERSANRAAGMRNCLIDPTTVRLEVE